MAERSCICVRAAIVIQLGIRVFSSTKMASAPYTPFFVPEQILATSNQHSQPQSELLQLPNEILVTIVEKVEIPHYLVVLGLTCKRMAAFLRDRKNYLPPWRGYQDKEGLYRLLVQSRQFKPKRLSRSGRFLAWFLKSDVPLQPYIPRTFRLCRACFVYLPRSTAYWLEKGFASYVDRFGTRSGFLGDDDGYGVVLCPACDEHKYREISNQSDFNSLSRAEREDMGRGFCPELERRLLKP